MDLTQISWLNKLLRNRWTLFLPRVIMLAGFVITIFAGLMGTPVGGRNFAIMFVWIVWWTILKLILIPFGGRAWCSICPIPVPGEWAQQGYLVQPSGKSKRKYRKWPKQLRGSWLQLAGFAFMGLFSAVLLTIPAATSSILMFLFVLAFGLNLVYERRVFCQYICPIGGFIGWYAQLAPIEVRARDSVVCAAHTPKTCYTGCDEGTGCPWGLVPATNKQNINCGLCMECQRTCPHNNMVVRLRPFGSELSVPQIKHNLDRTWFGLFMLACVPVYTAVMLGPWGLLKTAAYTIGSSAWFAYAAAFLMTTLGLIPGLFTLSVYVGWIWNKRKTDWRTTLTKLSYALIPLGMMSWIAFTISFAFGKLAYIWPVLSDPFGRGWDLFGTADVVWRSYLQNTVQLLQVLIMGVGVTWSSTWVRRYENDRQALPVLLSILLYSITVLWLLL